MTESMTVTTDAATGLPACRAARTLFLTCVCGGRDRRIARCYPRCLWVGGTEVGPPAKSERARQDDGSVLAESVMLR